MVDECFATSLPFGFDAKTALAFVGVNVGVETMSVSTGVLVESFAGLNVGVETGKDAETALVGDGVGSALGNDAETALVGGAD